CCLEAPVPTLPRPAPAQPLPGLAWPAAAAQAAMTPAACEDRTRSRAGLWCGYSAKCQDCTARAIARSLPAFNALHNRGAGNRHGLREAILRAMPNTEYAAARRMVWAWWQHDHPEAKAHAP
ncbi:MAG: hypothetical protein RJA36_464, partial [Pseudomonadota bacterium]